ncbi:MAG: hypothetical protein K9W43_02955 [Candidatus Thorarchaeota archaeon]|nr:hypothetical protein [Candidatus Thorarchaeota archaeon]
MALENEPDGITTGEERFAISAYDIASRTLTLWLRRILEYIIVAGAILLLYQTISLIVIMVVTGSLPNFISFNGNVLDIVNHLLTLVSSVSAYSATVAFFSIGGLFVSAFVTGATIKFAYSDYGTPGNGTVRESLSFATSRMFKLIGIGLLRALITGAFFVPLVFVMFAIAAIPMTDPYVWMVQVQQYVSLLLLSIIILFIGVYVIIRLTPAMAVGTIEDLGVVDSVKRAYRLSGRNFWHILGGMILVWLGVALLNLVIMAIVSLFVPNFTLASSIGGLVGVALFSAIDMIFQTVLYRDLVARANVFEETYW